MEKTHVYIDKEFAAQIEAVNGDKLLQEKVIEDILQRRQREVTYEMDILDEQVLQFKLAGSRFERALADAYDAQDVKIQKIIDVAQDQHQKIIDSAKVLAGKISPLKQELDVLLQGLETFDKRLCSINQYRIQDFLNIVERISALSEQDKTLMLKLVGCNN
jgi:hypothetical protein